MPTLIAEDTLEIVRTEANFDRVCNESYHLALLKFGIDIHGNCSTIDGYDVNTCELHVEFSHYTLIASTNGKEHVYEFTIKIFKFNEGES